VNRDMSSERQLEELLDRELGVAQTLAGILEQERAALVGEASHAVATLASKKAALLEQLEKLESERKSLGAAAGAAQERDATSTGRLPSLSAAAGRRWQSLMGLVATCRDANEANGLIVNLRQGQVRALLDIVRSSPAVTYGPQGRTFAKAVRPLARA
jgi:flagellar biosynthesis protein FlgN